MTATRDGTPPTDPAAAEESGPPSAPHDTSPPGLTPDEFFHALQEERRRHVLRYLLDHEDPVTVDRLAEWVVSREAGTDEVDPSAEACQRTYLSLYQSHLPKLDGLGLVDYDQSEGTVAATATTEHLAGYLGIGSPAESAAGSAPGPAAGDEPRGWRRALAGANVVGAALLALAWFGPFATLAVSFRVAATVVLAIHTALTAALFVDQGR